MTELSFQPNIFCGGTADSHIAQLQSSTRIVNVLHHEVNVSKLELQVIKIVVPNNYGLRLLVYNKRYSLFKSTPS